eukprot:c48412_g1_i1.p3 GENE.c48412_g1_i1~~c48412_g1_i1.p3  ORF type:complete len:122 (+),score=0.70 c48412_g1_i1:437-802(+)
MGDLGALTRRRDRGRRLQTALRSAGRSARSFSSAAHVSCARAAFADRRWATRHWQMHRECGAERYVHWHRFLGAPASGRFSIALAHRPVVMFTGFALTRGTALATSLVDGGCEANGGDADV